MAVKYTTHFHLAVGVNIIIEISPEPPFVTPIPEPISTVTDKTEDEYFSVHEHEMLDLPSLNVGFSTQGKIGNEFMLHSHFYNSTGLSFEPPGTYTMNVVYSPPPLDIMSSNVDEYITIAKNDYLNFFKENVRVDGRDIIIKNSINDYTNTNWKDFIDFYIKNNLEVINAKFENY